MLENYRYIKNDYIILLVFVMFKNRYFFIGKEY